MNPIVFSLDGLWGYTTDGGCGGTPNFEKIDLTTNSVVGTFPMVSGGANWDLAVSPDGTVALGGSEDKITVISLATDAEVAPLSGYSFAVGMVFRADGARAYVVDGGTNELITLDTTVPLAPVELLPKTPIPTLSFAWKAVIFGNRLYVVNAGGPRDVTMFDVSTDPPVFLPPPGPVGGGYEIDVAVDPSACKRDGWKAFGGFKNQGQCIKGRRQER